MAREELDFEYADIMGRAKLIMTGDYNDYKVEATLKDGTEIVVIVNSSSIDSALSRVRKSIIDEDEFAWHGATKVSVEIYHA